MTKLIAIESARRIYACASRVDGKDSSLLFWMRGGRRLVYFFGRIIHGKKTPVPLRPIFSSGFTTTAPGGANMTKGVRRAKPHVAGIMAWGP